MLEAAFPDGSVRVEDLTGGGDHFRVEVASSRFADLSRIEQHRLVYDAVAGDLASGAIHALSIRTTTPPAKEAR